MTDTADLRRLRAAGDDPARAPRRAHQLRPHLRADQRAGDRAARRGQAEHADLPRAGGADGLRRSVLRATSDEALARDRASSPRRAGGVDFADAARARLGQADHRRGAVRRGRLPDRRAASAGSTRPASAFPTTSPNYESAASTPELARALSAGDDLAAGAQLPQLDLRQRHQPARASTASRCSRSSRDDAAARGIVDGAAVRIFNDRGSIVCKAVRRRRGRGRASSTASASGGTSSRPTARNGNELTHQRLTDIGRAPSFYDCLVEVEPAPAHRPRREARRARRWRASASAACSRRAPGRRRRSA